MAKRMIWLCLSLSVLLVSSGCSKKTVTAGKFGKIKEGMNLSEVEKIMGAKGKLMASARVSGIESRTYVWMNAHGSNCVVEFSNGKVVAKVQAGLEKIQTMEKVRAEQLKKEREQQIREEFEKEKEKLRALMQREKQLKEELEKAKSAASEAQKEAIKKKLEQLKKRTQSLGGTAPRPAQGL